MEKLNIVGNWKMTLNRLDSIKLANSLKSLKINKNLKLEIAPTSLYLYKIAKILRDSDTSVISQNFDFKSLGSQTGGICLYQLKEIGVKKTIIGHSERRSIFNETDEHINNKLKTILNTDFEVIYCFDSVSQIPFDLIKENLNGNKLTVAYEPTWAIGTGKTASLDHINEIHSQVRSKFNSLTSYEIPILYGGSVNPNNSGQILNLENVNGVLVGGASTEYEHLVGIVNSI
tara:strand:- start:2189 stop:2881 length:693 start_codon:yes stop_codon:yes gene_type:complete